MIALKGELRDEMFMTRETKALLVHLLTATGAVFAMLAMLAAANGQWGVMFLWLVVAFAVDGADGPLARRYDVASRAPRFDGVLLDLIIDYLTYVFIPAFALFQSGLLPRAISLPMILGWTFFAGWAAWVDFHPESWAHWGLMATSLYLLFAGIAQQIIPPREPL